MFRRQLAFPVAAPPHSRRRSKWIPAPPRAAASSSWPAWPVSAPRRSAPSPRAAAAPSPPSPEPGAARRRAGAAAGCGASYWFLSGQPQQGVREESVKRFNGANAGTEIKYTEFQNDAYKTKIKTAIGAGQGPTIIWGWGGGGLREYVKNDQVEDLTSFFSENAALKDKLFPSAFEAATVDGKVYAMPAETVTPIVFYWNKRVFDKVGVQPPRRGARSWPWCRSSTRPASRRSRSVASPAGRT